MSRAIWRKDGINHGSIFDTPPYIYDSVNDEFTDTATGNKFSKNSLNVKLEDNKEVSITDNGEIVIEPTEGKDAMKKVTATVAVPQVPELITLEATANDTYTAPSGKGYNEVTVAVPIESNKAATIDVSQYTEPVEIEPTSGNDGMAKATVTLSNIPSGGDIEANKDATIDVSQYTEPVEITPTAGKDGMAKATVTLSNIPSSGDIDTSKWKVYPGYIEDSEQNTDSAVFLVGNTITDTGIYDVYVTEYDVGATGPATLTHISGQTWTVTDDGCQNITAEYTDTVSGNTYQICWMHS